MGRDLTPRLTGVRRDLDRAALRARNGLRHLSEVGHPPLGSTPRQLVWERDKVQLWRYDSERADPGPPVLLVMSLVTRPYVFDLRPGSSLVERLIGRGFDVFLLDWGVPDAVESANTLETYCDEYLPLAAEHVRQTGDGAGLTLFGYCLGGVFSLLFVAGHPEIPVRSVVVLGTPIDFSALGPLATMLDTGHISPDDILDETGNVPAHVMLNGLRLLNPTGAVWSYANLWLHLHDRRYVESHETLDGWARDHVPFPGAAFRQIVDLFVEQGCLVDGSVPLGDRTVELGDIRCPVLSVSGELDYLVPPASSDPLANALTGTTLDEMRFPTGHVGLFVGRQAQMSYIPAMLDWMERHSVTGSLAGG